jgi:hypothetical protein
MTWSCIHSNKNGEGSINEAYGLGQMGFGNEAIDMITGLLTQYQGQVRWSIRTWE